ncbi:hypothetical protein FRB96_009033 [Tulasnella sp. 330]|nr:hypothetical protein FRB96_009033 [Tulasnella sp. 330]KAG8871960.1 hypothetical protein FRB97_008165 [Tulasnella sp. 331]KAG8874634.1 hypothetical protein FRB98_008312 [Tulasnella sp. 332]
MSLSRRLPTLIIRPLIRLSSATATSSANQHHVSPSAQTPDDGVPPVTTPIVGQAPNRAAKWSTSQQSRPQHASIPRFEQTDMSLQPMPLSAQEMIAKEPIRLVHGRKAVCDGGGGALGHPKIFINLVGTTPKTT